MGMMTAARRRPALVWTATVLAAVLLLAGAFLLLDQEDGEIAVDLVAAIENRDLGEVESLSYTDFWLPQVADSPFPDHPWTGAKVVEVSPNDSAYDYDVTIEVTSTDLTLSALQRFSFSVGTINGAEAVLNPMSEATVTAEGGGSLTSVTIGGRDLGSGPAVTVSLLPGIYEVTATGDGGVQLAGRLTVGMGVKPTVALRPVA